MSTGRVIWVIWCLAWAGWWFVAGLLTLVGAVICWPAAVLSLLAVVLPVGKTRDQPCPYCGALGDPARLPAHLWAVHGAPGPDRPFR